jgi:hypothetical protein
VVGSLLQSCEKPRISLLTKKYSGNSGLCRLEEPTYEPERTGDVGSIRQQMKASCNETPLDGKI